jgi:hypothetical protein
MGRNNSDFYHGTDHVFYPGEHVEPRSYADVAYASTNREVASGYGANLYKVEPIGEVKRQAGAAKEFGIYHSKEGFRVIGKAE